MGQSGSVDASSWRPPVSHDLQPLNQEVIDTSLDVKRGISDRRGDIPDRKKYARGGSVTEDCDGDERASGGRLTARDRQSLPKSDFALPGRGKGPKGAGSGSYPIPDESHARNALARASGKPVEAAVRAKVHAKYPGIGEG